MAVFIVIHSRYDLFLPFETEKHISLYFSMLIPLVPKKKSFCTRIHGVDVE